MEEEKAYCQVAQFPLKISHVEKFSYITEKWENISLCNIY